MNLLAVSGSLQARSSNGMLLQAVASELAAHSTCTFSRALHDLPPFNVDADTESPPDAVRRWRAELAAADAIAVATPEYAFGIAGSLKNALDWVVGSGEFVHKPVLLLAASTLETGGALALEALERTMRVMSADVVASLSVPFVRAKLDAAGIVTDPELRNALSGAAKRLYERAAAPREGAGL